MPSPPTSTSPAVSSVLDQLSSVLNGLCELGMYAVLWAMNSPPGSSGEELGPEEQEAARLRRDQKWSKVLVALLVAVLVIQVLAMVVAQLLMAVFWWDALKVMGRMLRTAGSRRGRMSVLPAVPGGGSDALVSEVDAWRHVKAAKYANRWFGKALGRSIRGWHRHGPLTEEEQGRMHAWYLEGAARREQYGAYADGALLKWLRETRDGPVSRLARAATAKLDRVARDRALRGELGVAEMPGAGDVESGSSTPRRNSLAGGGVPPAPMARAALEAGGSSASFLDAALDAARPSAPPGPPSASGDSFLRAIDVGVPSSSARGEDPAGGVGAAGEAPPAPAPARARAKSRLGRTPGSVASVGSVTRVVVGDPSSDVPETRPSRRSLAALDPDEPGGGG